MNNWKDIHFFPPSPSLWSFMFLCGGKTSYLLAKELSKRDSRTIRTCSWSFLKDLRLSCGVTLEGTLSPISFLLLSRLWLPERSERNSQPTINREITKVWWNYCTEYHMTVRMNQIHLNILKKKGLGHIAQLRSMLQHYVIYVKEFSSISKALYWVKNSLKELNIIWFCLYNILQMTES